MAMKLSEVTVRRDILALIAEKEDDYAGLQERRDAIEDKDIKAAYTKAMDDCQSTIRSLRDVLSILKG